MKVHRLNRVAVACGLALLTSVVSAHDGAVKKTEQAHETKISLNLQAVAVDEALAMIAREGGVTIRTKEMPKESPKVTAELKDVSVRDAVKVVTRLAGLTYRIVEDGIVVSGQTCGDKNPANPLAQPETTPVPSAGKPACSPK